MYLYSQCLTQTKTDGFGEYYGVRIVTLELQTPRHYDEVYSFSTL